MKTTRIHSTDKRPYTERGNGAYYQHSYRPRPPCVLKFLCNMCIVLCIFVTKSSAHATICDFNGSGLDWKGRGVQPVYLSCSSGRVAWQHPRAALRILLQFPADDRDFHGCIKASPAIEGARLFVEGHSALVPLYARDDGQPLDRRRCFTSTNGRAALYLEAEPITGFKDLKATFEYDLQPLAKGQLYDPNEECRPCTTDELVGLYCSADFAARGTIVAVEDDPRLLHTRVTFAASRVFQQTKPIFSKTGHSSPFYEGDSARQKRALDPMDLIQENIASNALTPDSGLPKMLGHMFVPLECQAKAGSGEFIVFGTVRLGLPILRCAPRVEDWKEIVRSAQDRAHCVLEI